MKTSKTIKIKIDSLPEEAKIGNILPGIKNNLIAAPLLGDADCELLFQKNMFLSQKTKYYSSKDGVTPSIKSGAFHRYRIKRYTIKTLL